MQRILPQILVLLLCIVSLVSTVLIASSAQHEDLNDPLQRPTLYLPHRESYNDKFLKDRAQGIKKECPFCRMKNSTEIGRAHV